MLYLRTTETWFSVEFNSRFKNNANTALDLDCYFGQFSENSYRSTFVKVYSWKSAAAAKMTSRYSPGLIVLKLKVIPG